MKNKNIAGFFQKNFWLLLVIVISMLPLTPLLHAGIFSGHDSPDHVARIANFYQNLKEGTFVPRWAGNLNWGYGHPILMFLYPLPSYVASVFMFLGFSVVVATKWVFAIGFVGSAVTMFLWIRKIWGARAGFAAALFYAFAPYRFVDLYVRGAIGENFFFIFPPLMCYFLLKLFETKRITYVPLTAVSVAGMVLSHNALAIMFLPFIMVYTIIVILQEKNKLPGIIGSFSSVMLGFGLSAFFLVPAFFEGKYTLRDIVTKNEIFNRFETFSRLLYSPWDHGGSGYMSVQVGPLHWLVFTTVGIGLMTYFLYRKTSKKFINTITDFQVSLVVLSTIFFIISVALIVPITKPMYVLITTLQKFQFPWRFLSLSVFTSSILAGFVASVLSQKKRVFVPLIGFIVVTISIPFWQPDGYIEKPESFYTGVYPGTTDTGESAPVWSVRFMEKEPVAPIQIVEGEGHMDSISRTNTKHVYMVQTVSDNTRILENTLYFPGWNVFMDGSKVPVSELFFQDPNYRGLINFYINTPGLHEIIVVFTETKLRLLSNIVSLISGILVLGLLLYVKK